MFYKLQNRYDIIFNNIIDDQDVDSCSSFDAFNAMDTNVTKMRQKFHELLDDAFTLFGSRNSSLHSDESSPSISNNEHRSKSAPFRWIIST